MRWQVRVIAAVGVVALGSLALVARAGQSPGAVRPPSPDVAIAT